MDQYQLVEKLREKADVSYEQAKEALEHANWNLLDALVYLEHKGVSLGKKQGTEKGSRKAEAARSLTGLGKFLAFLINKGNSYYLQVKRDDDVLFSLPMTAFVLLLLFMFWWVLPIMLVSLFFHIHYALQAPDHEVIGVNRVMDKASDIAENLRAKVEEGQKK